MIRDDTNMENDSVEQMLPDSVEQSYSKSDVTDRMLRRSLVSSGDTARLAGVMQRAEKGESITFSVIGGSITNGSLASSPSESYAWIALNWWRKKYPWAEIKYINSGIGATDSYIAVHRVQNDLLVHRPDVVIVEFSVNDTDKELNKKTYDSLVRKIISSDNAPAVILLFTVCKNGWSFQDIHMETGKKYRLPMISYGAAVLPEIKSGTFAWEDISSDDIHPSSEGHAIIGRLLSGYFDSVYSDQNKKTESSETNNNKEISDYSYCNAELLNDTQIILTENHGFEASDEFPDFPGGWTTKSGGSLKFSLFAARIGIMYYRTTDGLSGTYSVYADGKFIKKITGDFSGGWGNCVGCEQVYESDISENHTIEIKPSAPDDKKSFTILRILKS